MGASRGEILVLGGGIIGCALAEELARRGRRVTVVERGRIGAEASSAAAGILSSRMDVPSPGPMFDFCQAARRLYPRWVARLEQRSGIDTGYHKDGILYLAMREAEERTMADRAAWQRRLGLPVERWSRGDVRRREPAVDGSVRSGFYFPGEAQIDNAILMRALATACRKSGVRLMERTEARRLRLRGRTVRGVETSRGALTAPVVVNCLGSWAGAPQGLRRLPVEPARGQILVFKGPKRLFRHAVMSERAYVVQRRDGRLLVGSTVERAGFEKALTLEGIRKILCGIRDMTSVLERSTFVEGWAGFRPLTPDRLPIIGRTGIEGLYVATGHFRHGILLAPVTASAMADLILTGRSSFDLTAFTPARFS